MSYWIVFNMIINKRSINLLLPSFILPKQMNIFKIVTLYISTLLIFIWGLNSSFQKSTRIHCETFGEYSRACEAIEARNKLIEEL
tara:strand:+ start:570 stop:824 length:255 start_codon:yes stop_codon:yes gene_type:complete